MGAGWQAVVTILHERYWGSDGGFLDGDLDDAPSTGREAAMRSTREFGDKVADVVARVAASNSGTNQLVQEIEEDGDWDDEQLVALQHYMTAEGFVA